MSRSPSQQRGLRQSVEEREMELRAELQAALLERQRADVDQATPVVTALLDRQIDLLKDTLEAHLALARVQTSSGWRMLEALRRQRVALRRLALVLRGFGFKRRRRRVPAFVTAAPLGVNVAGYLNTESGMGEAARLSVRSLEAAGIPVALNNVPSRLRMLDSSFTSFAETNPHPFNLVHLNADNMEAFARLRGDTYFRDRYTIGYWFWELAEFRRDWMPAFGFVDEVWTPSEFGRAALAGRSSVPVLCMPLPVVAPPESRFGRAHFNLPNDAFVFLLTFDVSSQFERKNPLGAVAAFRQAFGDRRDVMLALKFTNAEYDPRAVRQLYRAVEGINAVLFDRYMARDELDGLMRTADCYVSLHRSEGLGLGIAEAMAIGKPVVATRYSGSVDFMTASNSYPVDYQIVPIPKDYGPYLQGFAWAEPDIAQASVLMKKIVDDRRAATVRGGQAALDMASTRSSSHTGARVLERLMEIRTGRRR